MYSQFWNWFGSAITVVIEFQFETLTLKVMLLGAGDQDIKRVPTWTARISVL